MQRQKIPSKNDHKNPIFSFFPKQKEKAGPDGWKKLILITGTYSDWGLN